MNFMKLFDFLNNYLKENIYPFHMPGNKRQGSKFASLDFTEVEGLDNLYQSDGILGEVKERARSLFGTIESLILVNGSTSGILTAVTSAVNRGDSILIARNCHKSVYNAVELWQNKPYYVMPQPDKSGISGSIRPQDVENMLKKHRDIKACVVTSPTYEGVVSDIKSIAQVCRRHNVILIVDEAHGSHLMFSKYFPSSAIEEGGDIVIHSTHKTLTSLTGTGLLHICSDRVNLPVVKKRYQTFQTSSPNYILMASVDECVCNIIENRERLFSDYPKRLSAFYKETENLKNLSIFKGGENAFDFDRGKIVILTDRTNIYGSTLQKLLRENYKIETEMAASDYVVAMTSINDTDQGFNRLTKALFEIDKNLEAGSRAPLPPVNLPKMEITPSEAEKLCNSELKQELIPGEICREYIYAYPPGIPLIVPGEVITKDIAENIKSMMNCRVNIIRHI